MTAENFDDMNNLKFSIQFFPLFIIVLIKQVWPQLQKDILIL